MPTKLAANLHLSDSSSELRDLSACWDGGCLEGDGTLGTGTKRSQLELSLHGVPLAPFGKFLLPEPGTWMGKVNGKMQWSGRMARPSTWKAEGQLTIKNVIFEHWPFQREETFASFVPVFKDRLKIEELEVPSFNLQNSRVRVDSMVVRGDGLDAIAQGSWSFPQRLDFRLQGTLSEDICEDLPRLTRLALPKTEDGGGKFKASLAGTFHWQALTPDAEHYGTALQNLF